MVAKFQPRDRVKDVITGYEGIVIILQTYEHQEDRYHIQPTELKDGSPQEGEVFDVSQLELVQASDSGIKWKETSIKPGMKAEDKNTDLKGVVMCIAYYHTGCNRIGIQPSKLHENIPAKWAFIDEGATIIKEKKEKKEVKEEAPRRKTGGWQPKVSARQ